ncbi:hypothetical protein LCGC14_2977870, partial [marine sediment metagenome]
MPEFTWTKRDGQQIYDDYVSRQKYIAKQKDGTRGRETLRRIAGKTTPQLGYYWGLLLIEIHKQYVRDGQTTTVYIPKLKRTVERKPIPLDSHEVIKDVCGLVGNDGIRLDVGD